MTGETVGNMREAWSGASFPSGDGAIGRRSLGVARGSISHVGAGVRPDKDQASHRECAKIEEVLYAK